MSESVVYYSHTYYEANGSFDAVKCDTWSPEMFGQRSKHWVIKHNVVVAPNVTFQRKI